MIADELRKKLQNIVRGARLEGAADRCSTIRDFLIKGFGADPTVKSEFEGRAIVKEKQAGFLRLHAKETGIWLDILPHGIEYLTKAMVVNFSFNSVIVQL